jgi:lipopolysaccharide/colanic/teichoic acid biosynthesis glycosyltransferase
MIRGRAYCRGPLKRVVDVIAALTALVILAPLLLALALAILLTSGVPVLFAQERVGMDGRNFRLLKFRTMRRDTSGGPLITASGDRRVTRVGRCLRATKLDELPQLVHVLAGQMSIVGPRPEVPRYVSLYTAGQRRVLETRPGLTDPASVQFVEEEALLAAVPEERRERYYVETILPKKLRMNLDYIERAEMKYDLTLVLRTIKVILMPPVR